MFINVIKLTYYVNQMTIFLEEANEKPASKEEKPAAAEKAAAPAAPVAEQKEQPEEEPIANQQPLSAQKKGQNEFVSFVEPPEAKQTK